MPPKLAQDIPRHQIFSTKVFVTPEGQVGGVSVNAAVAASKQESQGGCFCRNRFIRESRESVLGWVGKS